MVMEKFFTVLANLKIQMGKEPNVNEKDRFNVAFSVLEIKVNYLWEKMLLLFFKECENVLIIKCYKIMLFRTKFLLKEKNSSDRDY